jgi:hypothetical protein
MKRTVVLAAAIVAVYSLSGWPLLLARGSGGHGGGGHAGGHGHASSGQGSSHATGSRAASASGARERGGRPVAGTAVPRASTRDQFIAGPSTYAPYFTSPYRRVGFGQRFYGNRFWPGYGLFGYSYFTGVCATPDCSGVGDAYPPKPAATEATADGNLRLVVEPISAQVFVDGYFVGTIEDFYDTLAGLILPAGPHHLEFRAAGYETLTADVAVEPNRTITYRATLRPLR